ncbi:hypothetical protein [Nocardia jiangsuensis]|uniref:Uncharacterized protein n=1 Tax=Nocardia jiangsuensis TaxID=1691563 RepID=A0ABV8DNE5_9NOCA
MSTPVGMAAETFGQDVAGQQHRASPGHRRYSSASEATATFCRLPLE